MTTRGVRAFVEGVQRKLGLEPSKLTKLQTGGPDGDLGSNEVSKRLHASVRQLARRCALIRR